MNFPVGKAQPGRCHLFCEEHTVAERIVYRRNKWSTKVIPWQHPTEKKGRIVPQIAIAIGVLTSNRGGRPTNHFGGLDVAPSVPLQGAVGVLPLLGAIVGCHCSVVWLGERVKTNFGGVGVPLLSAIAIVLCYGGGEEGVDVVPLQGAILECYGRVTIMYYGGGKEGRPLLGEWIWCHCWVPFQGAIPVCCSYGRGAIAGCYCHCNLPL